MSATRFDIHGLGANFLGGPVVWPTRKTSSRNWTPLVRHRQSRMSRHPKGLTTKQMVAPTADEALYSFTFCSARINFIRCSLFVEIEVISDEEAKFVLFRIKY